MDGFWRTVETALPSMGWNLFSTVHFFWLAICALCSIAAALVYRLCTQKGKSIFRLVMSLLLIENLVTDQIFLIASGQWTLFHLPLHMCCFGSYFIIIHGLLKKDNQMLKGLIYAMALPCAILALFTPNWSVLPVLNFSAIQSWIFHIAMVMYAVMMLADGYVPSFVHIRKAVIPIFLSIAAIFVLNKLIDTDFLFMNGGDTVGWVNALVGVFGIYGYLFIFPVIITILWVAMFLPFDMHRIKKLKKLKLEHEKPI